MLRTVASEILPDADSQPHTAATENALGEIALSAIMAMQEGVVLQDRDGMILICNPAAEAALGRTREELMGRSSLDPCWHSIHEDGTPFPGEMHPAMITLREGISQRDVVIGISSPNGNTVWLSVNSSPIFNEGDPHPAAVVVTFTDISERKWMEDEITQQIANVNGSQIEMELQANTLAQSNALLSEANNRLKALATTDGLTGLKNHRAFQERLAEEFRRATRHRADLSLILLDVDKFKQFNDTHGHPAGDKVLQAVAQALQQAARETDFVARYGGEEFIVILPETDYQGALLVAERFRVAIESHGWELRPVTASFGVATLHPATKTPPQMIDQADKALYASKAAGRNCVMHFTQMVSTPAVS